HGVLRARATRIGAWEAFNISVTPATAPSPTTSTNSTTSTSTTTTTSTSFVPTQGQVTVAPSDGASGTVVNVQGSNCVSDAGHIEVFLATTEAVTTRLAEGDALADSVGSPGDWSAAFTVPQGVAAGSDYLIEAQCWGDGTGFGHPGMQVVYF